LETTMNNVPALFARMFAGILSIVVMAGIVQADTVVQVNLNGQVDGIFGKVSSYQVQLFDSQTPITVSNFLNYVNSSAYTNTIFHRDVPGFVLQGGGFKLDVNANNTVTAINPIATNSPIQLQAILPNDRGTLAMARTSDPNSATSQWFVNLVDNDFLNASQNSDGYAVFGHVAGEGMTLLDAAANTTVITNLNALYDPNYPLYKDQDPTLGPFATVPLMKNDPGNEKGSYFVTVKSVSVITTVAWKGGTTDWGVAANWGSGSVPNGAGVSLSLGNQATNNFTIEIGSADRKVGNIYYTPTTSTTIQSTAGKSLILDNSGNMSLVNVLGSHTISAPVILNNNTLFSVNGAMTVSGAISGTGTLAMNDIGTLTLSGSNSYSGNTLITSGTLSAAKAASLPGYNASGKVTISEGATLAVRAGAATGEWAAAEIDALRSNAVFNSGSFLGIDTTGGNFSYGSGIGGGINFTKLGANTLMLTGANTYSGNTLVNGGTLAVGSAGALPGYNALDKVTVNSGATLAVRAGAATGEWVAADIDTLRTDATFNSGSFLGIDTTGGNFSYGSVIGGSLGITKLGANTLTLTGVNIFSGAVNFNGGLIRAAALNNLGAGTALNFNGGGLQFDGVYDPSVRNITFQAGGATLDTQGNNVTLANGIGNSGTGALTKNGSGTLILAGANTFSGAVNFNGGLIKAATLNGLGAGTALNFNGGGLQFGGVYDASVRTMTFQAGGATLDTQGNNVTLANAIGNSGAGGLTKNGSGTLTLTGSNAYTGNTLVNGGTLTAGKVVALPGYNALGKVTVNSGATLAVRAGAATGEWVAADIDTLRTDATFNSGSFLGIDTTGGNFSYGSVIGGSIGLNKLGANTLTLTGANTYSGNTLVNGGTLMAVNVGALPGYNALGKVTVNSGATLAVRAGAATGEWAAADIDTLRTDATFNSGSFLGIDTTGGNFSYGSVIGGSLGVTKLGVNTLTLTGVNTFSGAVNFNGGLIKADALNNLGAGTALNFNGGGLQFGTSYDPSVRTMTFQIGGATLDTQANNITLAQAVGNGGIGGLTKNGAGILEFDGAISYGGATTINAGVLKINNNLNTTLGAISGAGNLAVNGASTVLTADSINVNTLTLGVGSRIVIAPIPMPGSGLIHTVGITPVPEPSALVLLIIAALATLFAAWKRK
jgi:autotransporter-associated beta strand protein